MPLLVKLVAVGGDTSIGEVEVTLPAVIGRSTQTDVRLPHPLVSRKHCELTERDGKLFARDLGSLNGTLVNGKRIAQAEVVMPDELITVGPVVFRAVYQPGVAVARDSATETLPLPDRVESRQTARIRETTTAGESPRPPEFDPDPPTPPPGRPSPSS